MHPIPTSVGAAVRAQYLSAESTWNGQLRLVDGATHAWRATADPSSDKSKDSLAGGKGLRDAAVISGRSTVDADAVDGDPEGLHAAASVDLQAEVPVVAALKLHRDAPMTGLALLIVAARLAVAHRARPDADAHEVHQVAGLGARAGAVVGDVALDAGPSVADVGVGYAGAMGAVRARHAAATIALGSVGIGAVGVLEAGQAGSALLVAMGRHAAAAAARVGAARAARTATLAASAAGAAAGAGRDGRTPLGAAREIAVLVGVVVAAVRPDADGDEQSEASPDRL